MERYSLGGCVVPAMTRVLVPVRYPPSEHSRRTLAAAVDLAEERDADITVLHVDPYHWDSDVTRSDLRRAVEREFGRLPRTRYVVREGFLVEETILEEIVASGVDVVVVGTKQVSRWRRALRRFLSGPDVEAYLREETDCELVTVG
jgi:nucleotide-binding universal stress UspA family protein